MAINLAEDLLECFTHLEPLQGTQVFALFKTQTNPVNPGIYLKNGGAIGLPLSEGDAGVLKAASNPSSTQLSPCDSIWTLPAQDFELQNPAWELFLQTAVAKVSAGLGVDSTGKSVSVKLDHISLRCVGSSSARFPSAKTSNNRQSFGTLIITLPSKHEDGEFTFSHGGMQMAEPRQSSAFDISYAACFSNVEYEGKPISSGHRLVLVYNLFHSTLGPDVLRAGSNKTSAKLDSLFSYWRENVKEETTVLASLLTDQVPIQDLSFNSLEGSNLQLITYLRQVAEQYGFCVYLANMERTIECNEDDYDDRMYEREIDQSQAYSILTRVVELDGLEVAKGMNFEEDLLLQESPFEDVKPDDDCGDEVVYMRTVVLFMPKEYRIDFFLTPTFPYVSQDYGFYAETKGKIYIPDVTAWCDRLSKNLDQSGNSTNRKDLEEVCKRVTNSMRTWRNNVARGEKDPQPFSTNDIARVVVACVDLDDKERFIDAFEMCPPEAPASTFKHIAVAASRYQLSSILPKLTSHVSAFNTFSERFDILSAVREGLTTETVRYDNIEASDYQQWIEEEAYQAMSDEMVTKRVAQDGFALAKYCNIIIHLEMLPKVVEVIKRNIHYSSMVFAFQASIFEAGARTEGHLTQDMVRTLFAGFIPTMLYGGFKLLTMDALVFPASPDASKDPYAALIYHHSRPAYPILDPDRIRAIAIFLCNCQSLNLATELGCMLISLLAEAETIKLSYLELVYLPFLETLGSLLQELVIHIHGSRFQMFFQKILTTYIERCVLPEPQRSRDWSRPTIVCDCEDCPSLNQFLAHPMKMTATFNINSKRRDHVYSKVAGTGIDHYIQKTSSCHSLILTKNDNYFVSAHKAWESRCVVAKTHIQRIDAKVNLKPLLAERYDSIIGLEMVARPQLSPVSYTAGNHVYNQNEPQTLQSMTNNIQRHNVLGGPANTPSQWQSSPQLAGNFIHETRAIPQGTKRKATDPLESNNRRRAPEFIVIDE